MLVVVVLVEVDVVGVAWVLVTVGLEILEGLVGGLNMADFFYKDTDLCPCGGYLSVVLMKECTLHEGTDCCLYKKNPHMAGTGGKNEVLFAVVVEDGGVEEGISGLTSAKTMVDP